MERPIGIKVKDIVLTNIRVQMELHQAMDTDIFDDDNENIHEDTIIGKILYFDPEMYNEENVDEEVIGNFNLRMLYGTEQKIFNTFLETSSFDVRYEEEIFHTEYFDDGRIGFYVKEEYEFLVPEIYENSFIILDRIEINEMYRGNGILGRVVETISRIYRQPIIAKPFPLQYEGNGDHKNFKSDLNKVVNSYKKCGFERVRKRSPYLVKQ